jgi:hypothetical protein
MRTLIEILAGLAILAIICGTDVFGAIILRPAIAAVDDRTLTQLVGHIHRIADRRLAVIGISGLIAAIATAAVAAASGHWASAAAGALATLALIIYNRVSKPVNIALTTPAVADRVPDGRSQAPSPLGLSHQRARRAPNPRPRRAVRRARRGLTPTAPA